MNRKTRRRMALPALAGFAALLLWGLHGVPAFGHYRGPYGDLVNAQTVPLRHITDAVTAVNFDFRGFDTMGEEFILFSSVIGVLLLLRQQRDETKEEEKEQAPGRDVPRSSDAVRGLALGLTSLIVIFGVDIVVHGQLTPGGGFQGGVILAVVPMMTYLAGDFEAFARFASHRHVESAEALGAAGYILVGLAGVIAGAAFLENVLPLGQTGSVFSAGTVAVIDISVGLEVASGFVLLAYAFLEETLMERRKSK